MRLDLPALPDRNPRFLGVFSDTTFAFSFPLTSRDMTRPTGRIVDTVPFLRLDRAGAVTDTIALVEAPGREFFEAGPMRGLEKDILGDALRAVVTDDELVLTRGREVRHPSSGSLRAYETHWDPLAPTADMVRAERQRRIDDSRAPRVQVSSGEDLGALHRAVIERLPAADTLPAFDGLATGYDSSIWVRRFVLPGDTVSHWYLLDRNGGTRANLRLPVDERVESGTADRVVVSGRDTLGAVVLRVLELEGMP